MQRVVRAVTCGVRVVHRHGAPVSYVNAEVSWPVGQLRCVVTRWSRVEWDRSCRRSLVSRGDLRVSRGDAHMHCGG